MSWSGSNQPARGERPDMLRFLRRKPAPAPIIDSAVPEGMRVYAIGDIHGRADLLGRMAGLIEAETRERPIDDVLTVCLGDYIDRGPDSFDVIERLARSDFPTPLMTLMGNHEDVFGKFMRGSVSIDRYLGLGGDATLASYRLDPYALFLMQPDALEAKLRSAIPSLHLAFLDATRLSFTLGDYFFCHAGARPGVPLDRQSEEDLMWIREEFLRSDYDFGKIIVHGHTPVKQPQIRPNGINVDTRAFASGVLTALVLEGTERRFLSARM